MDWTKIIVALIAAAASIIAAFITAYFSRPKDTNTSQSKARPAFVFASVFSTLLAIAAFLIAVFWHQGPPGPPGPTGPPGQISVLARDTEKVPRQNKVYEANFNLTQTGILIVTARGETKVTNSPSLVRGHVMARIWINDTEIANATDFFATEDRMVGVVATAVTHLTPGAKKLKVLFDVDKTTELGSREVEYVVLGTTN